MSGPMLALSLEAVYALNMLYNFFFFFKIFVLMWTIKKKSSLNLLQYCSHFKNVLVF